jgi:TolA-binding protein
MTFSSERSQANNLDTTGNGPNGPLLAWVPWLQAGVTAMLVVLFLVVVGKARQQSSTIRDLQERVQGLENSRTLDRTTGLEEQLRTTVERLQALERNSARIDAVSQETASLRQELARLRAAQPSEPPTTSPRADGSTSLPPLPPIKP